MNRWTSYARTLELATVAPIAIERFNAKVSRGSECWLFMGAQNSSGYGTVRIAGRRAEVQVVLAHRLAIAIALGACPGDREVDHLCRIRICVRPAHLRLVTGPENEGAIPRLEDEDPPFDPNEIPF